MGSLAHHDSNAEPRPATAPCVSAPSSARPTGGVDLAGAAREFPSQKSSSCLRTCSSRFQRIVDDRGGNHATDGGAPHGVPTSSPFADNLLVTKPPDEEHNPTGGGPRALPEHRGSVPGPQPSVSSRISPRNGVVPPPPTELSFGRREHGEAPRPRRLGCESVRRGVCIRVCP